MCGDPWLKKGFATNFRTRPRTASISHYFCSFFYWSFQCNFVSFFAGRNAAGCPTEYFVWILNKRPAAGATCQCLDRRQKELIPSIWSPSKIDTTHSNRNIVSFFLCLHMFIFAILFISVILFWIIFQKSFFVFCLFLYFFNFSIIFCFSFYFYVLIFFLNIFLSFFFQFFRFFFFILLFFFLLFLFFSFWFYFFLCFPYFRGNSLNSRADLEFKEFRLLSTMIFQGKFEIHFFFKKSSWKMKKH